MSNPVINNRCCKFAITKYCLENSYEVAKKLFSSGLIIYKAEFTDFGNTIEYHAFHEKLPVTEPGYLAPIYVVVITKIGDRKISITLENTTDKTRIKL
ncbi:hypothetical protein A2619_04380 [candidate division WWE3 bacterium RIFOXYD1_FULL_39_9]|uniref:Uncharacterized protein n=1 Tax=candidate division WWE3 bacterium RIFOXYD1_FULL_39_9 TaxID=1802649 RepID=A0A1F4X6C5_UNCKA|nr:MAG: hypothetical protein A2619_04380 [candidate division WWE3 bacterium RIFOXYD1_FULL_39_9]